MKCPPITALTMLTPGQSAVIHEITGSPDFCRLLQDMGFLPGTAIACVAQSPHRTPRAYLVRGSVMALRTQDARCILVREVASR